MNFVNDENLLTMRNDIVLVSHVRQDVINIEFIGKNLRTFFNVRVNNRHDGFGLEILDFMNTQFSVTLHDSQNRSLGFGASSLRAFRSFVRVLVLFFPAIVRLVYFNISAKWVDTLI